MPRGCSRWPNRLLLLGSDGRFVRGRCNSSNLCVYCLLQELAVIRRMLTLDVETGIYPEILMVFGTGLATPDPAPFYEARRLVMRRLNRAFGNVEYAALSEFTTGKSRFSGGLRRPHWNLLVKGPSAADVEAVRELAIDTWCGSAPDADPSAQYVEPLHDFAAFGRYVVNHFQKTDQQPPADGSWKGKQRFNCSRRYFGEYTRAQQRKRAWLSLQFDREVFKAHRAGSADPLGDAQRALDEMAALTWVPHDRGAVVPESVLLAQLRRASILESRWCRETDESKRNEKDEIGDLQGKCEVVVGDDARVSVGAAG